MVVWKRNLLVLWIGTLITSSSFSMVVPFLPLFLMQIGVHHHIATWSGALYSVSFLAGAISSPFWGAMADRYGRKPMIIRAGFVLFFVYTMTAFVTNPYELLALRIIQGLLSGYIPGAIALVATNTPEESIGYALSMISAASSTGTILGPLLGGLIAHFLNNRIAFASAGIFVLLSTLLVIFWVKEENFVKATQPSSMMATFKDAAANRPLLAALLLNMFTALSIMTIEPVITLYIAQLTHSTVNASLIAGFVFSLSGIASALFAPLWGRLADKIGFPKVLLFGLIGGALWTFMQLPFENIWWFASIRFIYGIFFSAVFPAINGLVVTSSTPSFRGRAFGLNQTANQLGSMLGPIIGGFVVDSTSIHGLFWITGIFLTIVFTVSFYYLQVKTKRA